MSTPRRRDQPFLIVCPTVRDRRELLRLSARSKIRAHFWERSALWPDYYEWLACNPDPAQSPELVPAPASSITRQTGVGTHIAPVSAHSIELLLDELAQMDIGGIGSTDDYPGTLIAALAASRLSIPGPSIEANLLCQHKLLSRRAQAAIIPESVPEFDLVDYATADRVTRFPVFAKPVKSFFSIGAGIVRGRSELKSEIDRLCGVEFFRLLDLVTASYFPDTPSARSMLVETAVEGRQVTLDGYVRGGVLTSLGIVDSVMFPGTICFRRFEFPSGLADTLQTHVIDCARRFLTGIGFDNGCFNAEFIVDESRERVWLLEVNPRLSSQFADLIEKVRGINTYEVFASLCLGIEPPPVRVAGAYRFAASCVLRRFTDGVIERMPRPEVISLLEERHPGVRIELHVSEGQLLSSILQDGKSFRYGVINLGGSDREDVLERFEDCVNMLDIRVADRP